MMTKREQERINFLWVKWQEAAELRDDLIRRRASPETKEAARTLCEALAAEYRKARGWEK